jgi:hypothetical protein
MRSYLTYDPRARAGFDAWLTASGARLADQVDDPTYGLMQIYTPDTRSRLTAPSAAEGTRGTTRPSAYTGPAIREHGGIL